MSSDEEENFEVAMRLVKEREAAHVEGRVGTLRAVCEMSVGCPPCWLGALVRCRTSLTALHTPSSLK